MFSPSKLRDEVFCLKEERNFFESKYLEQNSEITDLKNQLEKAKKEISRLRGELMGENVRKMTLVGLPPRDTVEASEEEKEDDASSLTEDALDHESVVTEDEAPDDRPSDDRPSEDDDCNSEKSADQLRRSAEALLKWADYRSSNLTVKTSKTSAATSTTSSPSLSLPRDVESTFSQGEQEDDQSF